MRTIGLVGLNGSNPLELKVEQALQDHEQFGREHGLLLFDLDRFKRVNDSYGHDAGDALLQGVAATHEEVCEWLGDFIPESFSADEISRRLPRRKH